MTPQRPRLSPWVVALAAACLAPTVALAQGTALAKPDPSHMRGEAAARKAPAPADSKLQTADPDPVPAQDAQVAPDAGAEEVTGVAGGEAPQPPDPAALAPQPQGLRAYGPMLAAGGGALIFGLLGGVAGVLWGARLARGAAKPRTREPEPVPRQYEINHADPELTAVTLRPDAMPADADYFLHSRLRREPTNEVEWSLKRVAAATAEIANRVVELSNERQPSLELARMVQRVLQDQQELSDRVDALARKVEAQSMALNRRPETAATPRVFPEPVDEPPPPRIITSVRQVAPEPPPAEPPGPTLEAVTRRFVDELGVDASLWGEFDAFFKQQLPATVDELRAAGLDDPRGAEIATAFRIAGKTREESRPVSTMDEARRGAFERLAESYGGPEYQVLWPARTSQFNREQQELRRVGPTSDLVVGVVRPGLARSGRVLLKAIVAIG